ncbi:MAG: hypothetical protein AAGC68_07885 [Verrucomicrobiota bacterium]
MNPGNESTRRERVFRPDLLPCPFLPDASDPVGAVAMKSFRNDRGPGFYLQALTCAQSLWRQGLPAQAVLLLNRAFSAHLRGDEEVLRSWPLPYEAMRWILANRTEDMFIGNPRRHFQHLATRMVEPNRELRSWRAWGCWVYAREVFPDDPADERQITEEGIREPGPKEIEEQLGRLGFPGEVEQWKKGLTRPSRESRRGDRCTP